VSDTWRHSRRRSFRLTKRLGTKVYDFYELHALRCLTPRATWRQQVSDTSGAGLRSAAMARPSYPRAGEPRPAALPPAERTVGQLVAESIRIYGERFKWALLLGIAPAVLVIVGAHVSKVLVLVLAPTVTAALVSASYVGASVLVLEHRPSNRRLLVSWLIGWLVFIPAPFLVFAFVLPALAWLAAFGLVVPVLVVEDIAPRASFARAWRLARADYVHILGSLATLAIVGLLTQGMLAFILRGSGGAALSTAFFLANVVISPLLFIGSALLYVDQAARLRAE
jgi:MFS family permease